jgi:hypothetical protein
MLPQIWKMKKFWHFKDRERFKIKKIQKWTIFSAPNVPRVASLVLVPSFSTQENPRVSSFVTSLSTQENPRVSSLVTSLSTQENPRVSSFVTSLSTQENPRVSSLVPGLSTQESRAGAVVCVERWTDANKNIVSALELHFKEFYTFFSNTRMFHVRILTNVLICVDLD